MISVVWFLLQFNFISQLQNEQYGVIMISELSFYSTSKESFISYIRVPNQMFPFFILGILGLDVKWTFSITLKPLIFLSNFLRKIKVKLNFLSQLFCNITENHCFYENSQFCLFWNSSQINRSVLGGKLILVNEKTRIQGLASIIFQGNIPFMRASILEA